MSAKPTVSPLMESLMQKAGIQPEYDSKSSWNELTEVYEAIGTSIVEIGTRVNESVRLIQRAGLQGVRELVIAINGLRTDLEKYTTDLIATRKRHADKEGMVANGDELALMLSIYSDYRTIQEFIQANTFPVFILITEKLTEASAKSSEPVDEQAQKDLVNPDVISDIQVKEKTND